MHVAINAQLVSFAQTYRNAGVSRYIYTLLEGLSRAEVDQRYTAFVSRHEAAAAASGALGASATERVQLIASTWPVAHPVARILWEQLALPAALRRHHIDVFHSPVNVLPARLPSPSVVTIHDLAFLRYPQYFRPARRIYQRRFTADSVRRATLIVAVSESTRRDLVTLLGVPEQRVRVIYPSIDDDFRPVEDAQALARFRAHHGLPERYVLFLGTLEPRKNLEGLLGAYALLRARVPDTPPLVIAGAKGWYYHALFERVRALGLQRSTIFAGYVSREEQPLWYAAASVFVYPSFYEGFGLPVAEALACGTPTITSTAASLPESGGPLAMLVPPDDVEALAQAMQGVLADSTIRERTLIEGPRWTRRFSAAHMVRAYIETYREAARLKQPN